MWAITNNRPESQSRASAGKKIHIQPKLKIGEPGDKYEQEADRVADTVMRMPSPAIQEQPVEEEEEMMQMQSLGEKEKLQMQPLGEEGELQMKSIVQMQSNGTHYASSKVVDQLDATHGQGHPLPRDIHEKMSRKIGTDFSGVNVHTDSNSVKMNRDLGARAFTHGQDIYFNQNQFNPSSQEGKHLLAHELTHVRQQSKVKSSGRTEATTRKQIAEKKLSTNSHIIQRTPLTDQERGNLVSNIADEMNTAHADYNDGAQDAESAIAAANQAEAEIAKTIFAMGMALIVPGFGGIVAGGFARFGVTVSTELASNLGNAIGEAAKSAGNAVIDDAFQPDNPNDFFVSITNGWEEAARSEREYLRENVNNRNQVSDTNLTELHEYWVGLARNDRNTWKEWFREQWHRYQTQIATIGQRTEGRYGAMEARWIEGARWRALALTGEGRYFNAGRGPSFITWISPSLKDAAIQATERINYGRVNVVHYGNLERTGTETAGSFSSLLDSQFPPGGTNLVLERSSGTTRPPSGHVCPTCHGESRDSTPQFPEMEFPETGSIFPRQQAPLSESDRQELLEWIQRGSE